MPHSSNSGHDFRPPIKGIPTKGALNCIVVEDNNKQSALLKEYIAKTPRLNFAGKCDAAAEVYQQVTQSRADIIFWDIRLLDNRIMLHLKESGYYPIVICIADKQEQTVNRTEVSPHSGMVVRLFPEQDYGFVEVDNSSELYFTRNAVVGGNFDELDVGMVVHVTPAMAEGPMGPQAYAVKLLDKAKTPE